MTTNKTSTRQRGTGRPSRRHEPRRSPLLVVAAVIAVAAFLFAVAFAVSYDPDAGNSDPLATPSVTGQSLAPYDSGSGQGGNAPLATGPSVFRDGEVSIPVEGEPTVLVFLAHWCSVCQGEVPVLQSWLEAGGLPEGVAIRAVATGNDPLRPNYPPQAWLEREGFSVPTMLDDGRVAQAYGLTAYPYWVLVDADGSVVTRATGALSAQQLSGLAASLLE